MQNGNETLSTKEYILKYAVHPLPFIGGFLNKTRRDKVHRVVNDSSSLIGMTGFMMLNLFDRSMMEPWPLRAVKMLGEMLLGGLAGKISANALFMLVDVIVQKCCAKSEINDETPLLA